MAQFPFVRKWNAELPLGTGGFPAYLKAVKQPGESGSDVRMPNETTDDAVKIKFPKEIPEDGSWWKSPLFEQTTRVPQHEFLQEQKNPHKPFGVDVNAYLMAPIDDKMRDRLRHHETNFRKAGIPPRYLEFLPDLFASERLPWERTVHGLYGQVSNVLYQSIVSRRQFDQYGCEWYVAEEQRRKRSEFEVALAMQLQPSEAELKAFGIQDHYGLNEKEKLIGTRKKFRTPDENVGFAERKFGPPGLAEPLLISNSLGNHRFHSYNGSWQWGKMHGRGTYRFADETEYAGGWDSGLRDGFGETAFPDGSTYAGEWKRGYFHGKGKLTYANGTVYDGEWDHGVRQGKGKLTWARSGQVFEGMFYAGQRHGHGVQTSVKTGISFDGEWVKGSVKGNGSLIFKDLKTGKQRRIRRGAWHVSDFAPVGLISMRDVVQMVDKEDSRATRSKATDYVAIHGTLLAAKLNESCFKVKKALRDERRRKKEEAEEEKRQKLIDQKNMMAELRRQAKEAKEKAMNDPDFDGDDDEEEADD